MIEKLLTHARTLGMAQGRSEGRGSNGFYAVSRRENNFKFCQSRLCIAESKKDDCLCFNPRKPVPAEASEGERNFVFISRKYIAVCEPAPDSVKNISISVMKDKVKTDSSGAPTSAPVAAPVVSGQRTIISDQAAFDRWFSKLAGPAGHRAEYL